MGTEVSSSSGNPIDSASEPRKADTDSTPESMLIQEKDDPNFNSAEKPLASTELNQTLGSGADHEKLLLCLQKRIGKLGDMLEIKEKMKLQIFETQINRAYYLLWSFEANRIFKLLVVLNRRMDRLKKMR